MMLLTVKLNTLSVLCHCEYLIQLLYVVLYEFVVTVMDGCL